ncbi:MAG: transglycosylase domain-containing protein [Candidatus Gracilibacteria bacterium]|nr:transglycosylase domain-containing protein [Candidatus Gracilibacteria bacterium]
MKKILRTGGYAILLLSASYIYVSYFLNLSLKELPSSNVVYDTNSVEIGEIIHDNKIRHRKISYEEIPEFYKKALIQIEDKSFYDNNGIDLRGLLRSAVNNIKAGKIVEGGSTISSQYIRNNLWLNDSRGVVKKSMEFLYAIRLNEIYTKDEILEKYANQIYFGYLNYGLKSASIYFFGKDPENLTKAEQIALLVIPKNIQKYDPYKNISNFSKRFKLLTGYLEKNNIITSKEKISIESEKLAFSTQHRNKLPYFIDFLRDKISSESEIDIKVTIDYDLTSKIEEIGKNTIYDLAWKNVRDYGVLIVDRKSHELKVMIGGMNYYKKEGQVNSTLALRQPGSAIKPFTYLLAFEKFSIKPNDTILDLPVNYKTSEGYSYEPKNYSNEFKAEVTFAEALAQSINIPAVKLMEKVGVRNLLDFLKKLKVTSLNKDEDHYGLALTLGDGEMSLYELLQAYTIFPNDGEFCEFSYIRDKYSPCKKITDKKYTGSINEILTNRGFKLPGYPVNSALDFADRKIFVKTGTSRNFRDNWSIGYSDNYMIGVWTGNKDGANMKGVSGATGAGELFSRIVNYLEVPKSVVSSVSIGGKDIQDFKISKEYLEITNPIDSEKFQIDEFRPTDKQKIRLQFSTNISYDKSFWFMDDKKVEETFIPLLRGKHKLELKLLKDGQIIKSDQIHFEVQ